MTTAIYGIGSMGGAILAALASAESGEGSPEPVFAVEGNPERVAALTEEYAETEHITFTDAAEAARGADVHLILVKPYAVADLLGELAGSLRSDAVVVSMALGVSLADLAAALPSGVAAIRAMPNTPAQVGQGMTVLSPGESVTDEQLEQVRLLLAPTGQTLVLPEAQQDAATALSGSAPAYFYLVVEALVDAGVARGLTHGDALMMATAAMRGAGAMLAETGTEPAVLRAQVTSPGGSTAAALARLEVHGLRPAFADAVAACADRSAG